MGSAKAKHINVNRGVAELRTGEAASGMKQLHLV